MKDLRSQIALQLAELVEIFSQPFPRALDRDGWCERSWAKWGRIFQEMQKTFVAGDSLPDASIARAMDFDGIVGGDLLERAARVSNLIRHFHQGASPDA
jgi:hypothetical protein